MKRAIFIIVHLIYYYQVPTISQWELRYPDIPADFINDLTFTDWMNGYFVNEGGDVIQTTDSGITWKIKNFIADHNLKEIKFVDNWTGFSYVTKNVIYQGKDIPLIYTTDAGNTWNESQIALWGATTFLPISQNILIQAADNIQTLNNFYGNWQTTYSIPTFFTEDTIYHEEFTYGTVFQFEKLDNGHILAVGNSWRAKSYNVITDSVSFVLKSTDQGNSWDTLWCDLPYELKTISFTNNQVGWLGGEKERIYKTTDGGLSWYLQHADTVAEYTLTIHQIFALDDMNIYASTLGGLLISNDGGINWQTVVFPGYNQLKVFFKDKLTGYAYGSDLLFTTDGGFNWNRVSKSIKDHIVKIDFVSKEIGWALSYDKVYKTTDGGFSWTQQFTFSGSQWNEWGLNFIDSMKGWIVVYENAYQTTDGGINWELLNHEDESHFFGGDIEFSNSNLGVLCNLSEESTPGSKIYDISGLLYTTDAGINWAKIKYPINAEYGWFKKLRFITPDSLWAINNKGIWLSNDTGKTWKNIYHTDYFLGSYSFDFYNSTDGCFSEVGYKINFTSNAGRSWDALNFSKHLFIRDYQIVGKDIFGNYRIFAVGDNGRLLKYTQNGFIPDQYPKTYTGRDLNSLSLFMEDRLPRLWAAGEGFTILYGTTELISDLNDELNCELTNYNLSQNYPNPFNPSTKIRWQSPIGSWQTLKIYDVLGNEVATLVDEYKQAGSYEIEFNAVNLPSGVYFYQMRVGDYIQTKKMILLR